MNSAVTNPARFHTSVGTAGPPTTPDQAGSQVTLLDLRVAEHKRAREASALQRIRDRASLRVRTAHAGSLVPERAEEHLDHLVRNILRDVEDGAVVHRRIPLALRLLPLAVAALDALVLYLFCADMFNVRVGTISVEGVAAIALAALGTAVTYAWLYLCGSRLRDYRNRLGAIEWSVVDSSSRIMIAIALIATTATAALMYSRVQGTASTAALATVITSEQITLLAVVFGVFSICANLSVLAVHALDGSATAVHARDVGRAVRARQKSVIRQEG